MQAQYQKHRLRNHLQQLRLQDEFALLVFLTRLVRLVILPPDGVATLPARNVSDNVSACCHVTFHRFRGFHVHNVGEEEGFAMLAAEILRDMVVSSTIQPVVVKGSKSSKRL